MSSQGQSNEHGRELVVVAESTDDKMYLRTLVAEGQSEDGATTFTLCQTMSGLGYIIEVEHGGKKVDEILNLRDLVSDWVDGIVADIDE